MCKDVYVFAEQRDGNLQKVGIELIGEARKLADDLGQNVVAVLLGNQIKDKASELIAHGADKVVVVDDEMLAEYVTEPYAKDNPDLVRRMIDEGHVLGNHSVTHPSAGMPSLSLDKQENEVTENHAYIKENFGYDMYLFRYPTGRFSEQSLALLNNCNYKSIFWSFAYLDYDVNNQPDHASSLQKMKDKLHPGAIYLLHAESETNAAVLGDFIDAVRAAGYGFKNF